MNVQVTARVPEEVKKKAEKVLDSNGLDLQTAIRILLSRIASENRFPIDISKPASSISNYNENHPEYQEFIDEVSEEYLYA